MNTDLPEFDKRPQHRVMPYVQSVFGNALVRLIPYDDGHFRVVFEATYFVIQEGQVGPSKSQWSTLKKKMKRRNKRIFIFKQTGSADCDEPDTTCYYVDFGFFAY